MSSKNSDYKRQKSSPYNGVTRGDENYLFLIFWTDNAAKNIFWKAI